MAARKSSDCCDNCSAASSTWVAARPVSPAPSVTPVMLPLTSWVPFAASWTLRAISWVEAACSSTAEAMAAAISMGQY